MNFDLKLNKLLELKTLYKNLLKCNEILNKNIKHFCELNDKNSYKSENVLFNKCLIKMCRISAEYKALNESKQFIKNSKYFPCFWPKCQFKALYSHHLREQKCKTIQNFVSHLNSDLKIDQTFSAKRVYLQ